MGDYLDVLEMGVNIYADQRSYSTQEGQFREETDLSKRLHLMESFMEMQTQFILLDSDLVSSSRVGSQSFYTNHFTEC